MVRDLVVAAPVAVVVALLGSIVTGYPLTLVAAVLAIYAVAAFLILRGLPHRLPGTGLGPANRVTLGRLVLALPIGGAAIVPVLPTSAGLWWITSLALTVLALDGVDGWLARRTRTESRFGARFDMETDAALLMALSVIAWRAGPAGIWVLGIGLLRYLFVLAGAVEPRLQGDLTEDHLRRKTVCVLQTVALLVAVAPLGMPALQVSVAALALALLTWSFAIDVRWLLRQGEATRVVAEPVSIGPREEDLPAA